MSTSTLLALNSPAVLAHIFRICKLYRGTPPVCMRRWRDSEMRIEGMRAMVRIYERYCSNATTVVALREALRVMVAREWAREVVSCGKQVAA